MERRRNVLFSLAGVAGLSLVLALVGVPMMLAVNLIADAMLVGYVAMLAYLRSMAAERETKLRYLPRQAQTISSSFHDEVSAWADANPAYATAGAR